MTEHKLDGARQFVALPWRISKGAAREVMQAERGAFDQELNENDTISE